MVPDESACRLEPVSFRRTGPRIVLVFFVSVFGLVFLVMALPPEPADTVNPSPIWLRAAMGGLAVGTGWLVVRIVRSGIFADTHGVIFRNSLCTWRLHWDEIVRFEPPKAYGTLRNAGLSARLKDGSEVASSLYQDSPTSSRGFADAALTTLNAMLVTYLKSTGQLGADPSPEPTDGDE